MSIATTSQADRETLNVLNPFLEVLRSTAPIPIPLPTLEGALWHFLATLQGKQLDSYVEDVLSSVSLWRALGQDGVRRAVKIAPGAKATTLKQTTQEGIFKSNSPDKAAQKWLANLLSAVKKAKSPTHSSEFYLGLLEGVGDSRGVKWGRPRTELEEEVLVAAAEKIEKDEDGALDYFCAATPHVKPDRLRVLNLKAVVPTLSVAVFTALGFTLAGPDDRTVFAEDDASLYARGLSCSIRALAHGNDAEKRLAWETIYQFSARMLECGLYNSREWRGVKKPLVNGESWNRLKAAQTAFTTVEWPAVELLLQPTCPQTPEERCSLAALIVVTLSKFSILSDVPDTHLESYEKVLYGCLDIIATEGGPKLVHQIISDLYLPNASYSLEKRPYTPDHLAAFILVVAEQLIHVVDGPTLQDIAFPLAERHLARPEHRTSFEAANAFFLTLVETASQSLQRDPSQGAFVEALVIICASSLLRGARNGSIKADQLGAAYPGIIRAAARRNVNLVYTCVNLLDTAAFEDKGYSNTIKQIRVAAAPYIPRLDLPTYLDNLATLILATPRDSETRLELSSLTFKTIMQDMPDESKQFAIEWWLRWRRRIEGKDGETTARL